MRFKHRLECQATEDNIWRYGMREIPLTKGYIALVDAEDYPSVCNLTWTANETRGLVYAAGTIGSRPVLMHRFILGVVDPKVFVDHKNGLGIDNRRENLRLSNARLNQMNRGCPSNNISGYKGVRRHPKASPRKPYEARLNIGPRTFTIGFYATAQEAARAYDRFVLGVYGEHAWTNFPRKEYQ